MGINSDFKESKVSVIIPYFNSGNLILESIESVINSSYSNYEIIIVDDGSTDLYSLEILDNLKKQGFIIISQHNKGPGAARNKGVFHSTGEYLLFLDCDNKVKPDYLKLATDILDSANEIGVVYSKPSFFGELSDSEYRFLSRDFSKDTLLAGNYIDMCSIIRREVFNLVGGFDENDALFICEDWDFWIRISQTNWKFHFIDQELYEYRVRNESLMGTSDQIRKEKMLHYLGMKHGYLIHNRYRNYSRLIQKIEDKPFIFFLKIIYYKYILKKKYLTK